MTADEIVNAVSEVTGVSVETLKGHQRSTFIIGPRFLAYYLLWHLLDYGTLKIGAVMGKDHKTIFSGLCKAKRLLAGDPVFAGWYAKCLDRISERRAA